MASSKESDDHLERVLRSMTNADDLRELTLHMSERAMACFKEVADSKIGTALDEALRDGSLQTEAIQLSKDRFDEEMRRWLIAHGYL